MFWTSGNLHRRRSMKHELLFRPSFGTVRFDLEPGESVVAESGSMVAMSPNLTVKTSIGGTHQGFFGKLLNFFIALVRKILGGESMFLNTYTVGSAGSIWIAPAMVGDITVMNVEPGNPIIIQPGSFVASTPGVVMKTRWGGFRSIFGGEGAFLLQAEGTGQVWINSYGGIHEIMVDGEYICDTGHMVAFESTLNFKLGMAGKGAWTAFKSGEGLIFRFTGKGRLLIQSRNLATLVSWIRPSLP